MKKEKKKNLKNTDRKICDCKGCKNACSHKPGWFKPGEAEKVAESMGMSMKDFFDKYLAVDFFENWGEEKDTYVLSPAVLGNDTGEMFPYKPTGICVFLKEGKCSIHANSPFECAQYIHSDSKEEVETRHVSVKDAWTNNQKQIEELLGHAPYTPENEGGLFSSLFW